MKSCMEVKSLFINDARMSQFNKSFKKVFLIPFPLDAIGCILNKVASDWSMEDVAQDPSNNAEKVY